MRERTFLAAMYGLDLMLILAGGVMAWGHAIPPRHAHPGHASGAAVAMMNGIIVVILIAGIGGYAMYELNVAVLGIAESPARHRNSRWVALFFVVATLAGGMMGLVSGS